MACNVSRSSSPRPTVRADIKLKAVSLPRLFAMLAGCALARRIPRSRISSFIVSLCWHKLANPRGWAKLAVSSTDSGFRPTHRLPPGKGAAAGNSGQARQLDRIDAVGVFKRFNGSRLKPNTSTDPDEADGFGADKVIHAPNVNIEAFGGLRLGQKALTIGPGF